MAIKRTKKTVKKDHDVVVDKVVDALEKRIACLEKVEERSEERIKSLEMVALKTFLRIDRIVRAIDKSKSVRGL